MKIDPRNPHYRDLFADRREAGRQLARALTRYHDDHPLVLALPRGGVPVGFEIADALATELDVIFVRKLRAPGQPELGLGAVVDGLNPQRVLNEHIVRVIEPPPGYIEAEEKAQLALIEERKRLYRGDRPGPAVEGRTVIITDDGIATGGTIRAALRGLAMAGARATVLAVPVAPHQVLEGFAAEADDVVCLLSPVDFHSVGFYYADFEQTTDEEVIELLRRARHAPPAQPETEPETGAEGDASP